MLTVATLGPSGSNHEFVTNAYTEFIGVTDVELLLIDDFAEGVDALLAQHVDCLIQCAAHPDVAQTIGAGRGRIFIVDTFIAQAKPMGVLSNRDIDQPATIAFHPATGSYVDLQAWQRHIEVPSTVHVAQGLLSGEYDSGITSIEFAEKHPDRLRIDQLIEPPHDAWLVYATDPVLSQGVSGHIDGPGAAMIRSKAGD